MRAITPPRADNPPQSGQYETKSRHNNSPSGHFRRDATIVPVPKNAEYTLPAIPPKPQFTPSEKIILSAADT